MPLPGAYEAAAMSGLRPSVAQLHIALLEVDPPVWRRVLVPHAVALRSLHEVLQVVMGWESYHLWEFRAGERTYGEPSADWPVEGLEPARGVRLRQLAPVAGARVEYVYDYGDHWRHAVTVEALLPNLLPTMFGEVAAELPFCLAGAGACPPEDCGGPGGYAELLAVLADPAHPEHAAMRLWAGADFDPEGFSARQVNRELRLRAGRRGSTAQ